MIVLQLLSMRNTNNSGNVILFLLIVSLFSLLSLNLQPVQGQEFNPFGQGGASTDDGGSGGVQGLGEGFGQNAVQNDGFLEYSHPSLPFRILYPPESEVSYGSLGVLFDITNSTSNFAGPASTATVDAGISPNINMSLDEYSRSIVSIITDNSINHLIEYTKTTLDGHPAHTFLYAQVYDPSEHPNRSPGNAIRWVMTIVNNTVYEVTYAIDARYIDNFIPIATTMFNSFEISESASANQQQPPQQDRGRGFEYSKDIALLRDEVFSQTPRDESGTGFDTSPQEQGEEFNPFGQGGASTDGGGVGGGAQQGQQQGGGQGGLDDGGGGQQGQEFNPFE
jgi:hypothetical protein